MFKSKICLKAVKKSSESWKYVPQNKFTTEQYSKICLEAVKQDFHILQDIPEEILSYDMCLEVVKDNANALKYLPHNKFAIEQYSEICMEAIKQDWNELENIPEEKCSDEIYLEAFKQNYSAIKFIPKNKRNQIYLRAIQDDWHVLELIPQNKCNYEMYAEAIKQDFNVLDYIYQNQKNLTKNEYISLYKIAIDRYGIDKNPLTLRYLTNKTPEFCLLVIKKNQLAFQYLKVDDDEYSQMHQAVEASLNHANIREKIRENSFVFKPKGDYYIKALRGDEYNYFHRFANEIADPSNKFPKRKGLKKSFTVTGEGIFSRTGNSSVYPLKQAQYTLAEKENFTNFQSTSFGNESYSPNVFGFDKRNIVLTGVLLEASNVLLSNRLFLYDGGTVTRSYDFLEENKARDYEEFTIGRKLFSKNKFEQFKEAVFKNNYEYNEALIRLKWACDGTCQLFIASDTLNSRLLAKQEADFLQTTLIKSGKCSSDYQVPICFFIPNNSDLHFKAYTAEEYELDKQSAQYIFENVDIRLKYFAGNQYEFLLALTPYQITQALDECAIYMLVSGYTHIFRFLLEKVSYNLEDKLMQMQTRPDYQSILFTILEHAARSGDLSLVTTILSHIDKKIDNDNAIIGTAIENNLFTIAEKLIESGYFNTDSKNEGQCTALTLAADKEQDKLVKLLLKSSTDADTQDSLFTLIKHGRTDAVKLLLSNIEITNYNGVLTFAIQHNQPMEIIKLLIEKNANIEDTDKEGNTALHTAVTKGQIEILKLLLEKNAAINGKNNHGETVFNLAQKNMVKCQEIIQLLDTHESKNKNIHKM